MVRSLAILEGDPVLFPWYSVPFGGLGKGFDDFLVMLGPWEGQGRGFNRLLAIFRSFWRTWKRI